MTNELLNIIESVIQYQEKGMKCVLVTVVDLEGSSYRKPGVRMLLTNHGSMVGAVSGGCVEKEIIKIAQSVFTTGTSKVMVYDGRIELIPDRDISELKGFLKGINTDFSREDDTI